VTVAPTPANNGSEVTRYTVTRNDGTVRTDCSPGVACNFAGTNGTAYSFTVTATNGVGESAASASASETSYGKPSAPTNLSLSKNSQWAPSTFSMSWSAPGDSGGRVDRYEWSFSGGGGGQTSGLSATSGSVNAGSYTFTVAACSPAGCGPSSTSSAASVENEPPPPPPPPPPPKVPTITDVFGYDGPNTIEGVTNAYRVGWSWENFGPGDHRVTPKFDRGNGWENIAGTYTSSGDTGTTRSTAFIQNGSWTKNGILLTIDGTDYGPYYSFP
jgi:hypothetical protein